MQRLCNAGAMTKATSRSGEPSMSRRPFRVFLSSTTADLDDYRRKAIEAIQGLQNFPVAMETFMAKPGTPTEECQRLAGQADAVIVLVAHRYGFTPTEAQGGDGERSITWLEVEAAKANKNVLAFIVDPDYTWTGNREQDRIATEP